MCARVAEVVSVPGPRFSLASDSAVFSGRPDRVNVCIKLWLYGVFSRRALRQVFSAHCKSHISRVCQVAFVFPSSKFDYSRHESLEDGDYLGFGIL